MTFKLRIKIKQISQREKNIQGPQIRSDIYFNFKRSVLLKKKKRYESGELNKKMSSKI